MPFVLVAGATLPLGFLAAELSGVRTVGGAVLVVGLLLSLVLARGDGVGGRAQIGVAITAAALFVLAHPAGRIVGPAAAVLGAGVLVAVAATAARSTATGTVRGARPGPR